MRETAASNSSHLCVPIFLDVSAAFPGAAEPSMLLLECDHLSLAGFINRLNIWLLDRKRGCVQSALQKQLDEVANGSFSESCLSVNTCHLKIVCQGWMCYTQSVICHLI